MKLLHSLRLEFHVGHEERREIVRCRETLLNAVKIFESAHGELINNGSKLYSIV